MKNILEVYNSTIEMLKANKKVKLLKANINPPHSPEITSKAGTVMKMPFNQQMKDFIRRLMVLRWSGQ